MLLLWLLVGPRVQLPVAALRVEDLCFVALATVCALHHRALGRPHGVSIAVLAVAVAGVVSALVASARGMVDPVTSMLYAVRPLEYWIAFPATLLLLHQAGPIWSRRVDSILAVTTVLQSAFAILQYYFSIPVGFSHAAYTRAAGLTVGPYELGAISAALIVYWVSRGRWVLASLSAIALAASISRISVLAAALALAILGAGWTIAAAQRVARRGAMGAVLVGNRSRFQIAYQFLAVASAGLVLAFTFGILQAPALPEPTTDQPTQSQASEDEAPSTPTGPEPTSNASEAPTTEVAPPSETVTTRIADTSVLGSWAATAPVAAALPHVHTTGEYQDIAYAHINDHLNAASTAAGGGEASNLVRFFRWHLILDTFDDPLDFVFGLGPSFVGPSVDGSYLRFFADGGALGVLAWLGLIVMWLRRSPLWMTCITVALLVGAVFIDIVYAQRPMVLYWVMLGIAMSRTLRTTSAAGADDGQRTERVAHARPELVAT